MKNLVIALVVTPILLSAAAHKYYLSVTDIEHNVESASLQIISRLFYDDLEAVLHERYDETLRVEEKADQERLDRYIKKYVDTKLVVTVNGQEKAQDFIGKEYEDDYVVLYIEIPEVSDVRSVEIENNMLMDLFPDQKNMVHTEINGKKKSFLLVDGNAKALLNFSE